MVIIADRRVMGSHQPSTKLINPHKNWNQWTTQGREQDKTIKEQTLRPYRKGKTIQMSGAYEE